MPNSGSSSRIVFIITSVIEFKHKKLSYFDVRSKYSPLQRAEQTLTTILSIKDKVPNAYIVLVEGGLSEYSSYFADYVDEYNYIGDNFLVRSAVDSKNKSLGEALILLSSKLSHSKYKGVHLFKISGRYHLNDHFDLQNFSSTGYSFRPLHGVSTKLYSLGTRKHLLFVLFLLLSLPFLLYGKSIEATLGFLLPKFLYTKVSVLGIQGLAGPIGTLYQE